jgi:phosphoglycolate phosphatase-like HAD superfamily hydrolase
MDGTNRIAFFGFDRTLVSHRYSKEYTEDRSKGIFFDYLYELTALKDEHACDRPLPCMQWYAKKLQDEGYGLYCLTHATSNLVDLLKQEQLTEFYSETPMAYLTVDKPAHKIDMMRAVAAAEGCDLSDVLFVDDRMETVYDALRAGIDARHLSDVVADYETKDASEQALKLQKAGAMAAGSAVGKDPDIVSPEDAFKDMFQECRLLAERNGRNAPSKDMP